MSLAIEVAKYLDQEGVLDFDENGANGNTFIDHLPSKPDVAINITDVPGFGGDLKFAYDRPSIQVWVRGDADPRTAQVKAQDIYDALHGLGTTQVGAYWVVKMEAVTTPGSVGADQNGRYEVVVNFTAEVKALVAGNRQ